MRLTLTYDENDSRAIALINLLRTLDFVKIVDGVEYSESDGNGPSHVSEPAQRCTVSEADTDELTEQQRAAVHQAIASIDAGKGIPHDEVMGKAKERSHNCMCDV